MKKNIAVFMIILCATFSLAEEQNYMDMSLEELLNMEISVATKSKMKAEDAPSIVSVITSKEIRNMGAKDIWDILRGVPGLDIVNACETKTYVIGVRGLQGRNKTLFMINNHSVYDYPYQGYNYIIDRIPIANISRIEIIRGPGSAIYGAGAFTGVINIITKDGGEDSSKIAAEAGSFSTYRPNAEFSYNKDDLKIYIYADYYESDGDDQKIESDLAGSDVAPIISAGPLVGQPVFASGTPERMNLEEKSYNLQSKVTYKNFKFNTFLIGRETNNAGVIKLFSDENEQKALNFGMDLKYNMPFNNDDEKLSVRLFYDYQDDDFLYELFPEETAQLHNGYATLFGLPFDQFPSGEGVYGNPKNKGRGMGAEIMFEYNKIKATKLITGLYFEKIKEYDIQHYANSNVTGADLEVDGVTYPFFPYVYFGGMKDISENGNWTTDETLKRTIRAVYMQGSLDLKELLSIGDGAKSLYLTAGIRYDDYDDVGSSTNPRIGIVYSPIEKLYFKLLYGEAFRAPIFTELYTRNNPATIGNPNVDPETIKTFELLIGYNFTKKIKSNITFFKLKVEDVISPVAQSGTAVRLYDNVGTIESKGIEGEIKYIIDKNKYVFFNATYVDIEDTTNLPITGNDTQGDYFPGTAANIYCNMGVNIDFTEKINFNTYLNYIGKRDRSEEKGTDLEQLDQRDSIDDVTLVNMSLSFRNFIKGLEVQLSVFNLFDEDHRDPELEQKLKYDFPNPERTFYTRVSYAF